MKFLESCVQEKESTHMLRKSSRFANVQLQGAKLFIVDDVNHIKKSDADFWKPLAGKDIIASDEKFKNICMISPKCVVIIVSNFSPTHFEVLRDDSILNKINKVELRKEHVVTDS